MKQNNFYYLFFALLVLLLATPIVKDLRLLSDALVRPLGFSVVLAIGVWSFQGSRRVFAIGMFLAGAGILASVAASFVGSAAIDAIATFIYTAFLILAIVESLKQVAISSEISVNRLVGAVCVFLMLGITWALAYSLLYALQPGAFSFPNAAADAPALMDWLYYSFVTLTTLGYGDVVPVSASARALAYSEAVFGQLYVAILIAGLVSAYISARQSGER